LRAVADVRPDLKHADKPGPRRGRGLLWFIAGIVVALIIICAFPKIHAALYHAGTSAVEHAQAFNKSRTQNTPGKGAASTTSAKAKANAPRFDFYRLLKHPVQILTSDESDEVKSEPASKAAVTRTGAYILQVASLRKNGQAEKLKARLAVWGIASHIQKVRVQGEDWHRVRIGPISKLAQLNELREKLHSHQLKPLLFRVSD
jgi:cell division protein FtsN